MTTKTNKMETTILENRENSLKVKMNNQITLIAKYEDNGGEYFMNENLEKQYVANTKTEREEIKRTEHKEVKEEVKEEIKEYRFEVEYEHKGRLDGFALTETKVKAKNYAEALEKVRNNFKNIYEIAEV